METINVGPVEVISNPSLVPTPISAQRPPSGAQSTIPTTNVALGNRQIMVRRFAPGTLKKVVVREPVQATTASGFPAAVITRAQTTNGSLLELVVAKGETVFHLIALLGVTLDELTGLVPTLN